MQDQGWPTVSIKFTASTLNIKSQEYPELSSKFKAATVKTMLFYLAHRYCHWDGGDEMGRVLAVTSWALVTFIWQLDEEGLLLPPSCQDDCYALGRLFMRGYGALRHQALEQNLLLWRIRPKHHAMDHIIEDVKLGLNPARSSCFKDEDFLGKFKYTSAKCHGRTVQHRGLERYLPWIHIRAIGREKLQRWLL